MYNEKTYPDIQKKFPQFKTNKDDLKSPGDFCIDGLGDESVKFLEVTYLTALGFKHPDEKGRPKKEETTTKQYPHLLAPLFDDELQTRTFKIDVKEFQSDLKLKGQPKALIKFLSMRFIKVPAFDMDLTLLNEHTFDKYSRDNIHIAKRLRNPDKLVPLLNSIYSQPNCRAIIISNGFKKVVGANVDYHFETQPFDAIYGREEWQCKETYNTDLGSNSKAAAMYLYKNKIQDQNGIDDDGILSLSSESPIAVVDGWLIEDSKNERSYARMDNLKVIRANVPSKALTTNKGGRKTIIADLDNHKYLDKLSAIINNEKLNCPSSSVSTVIMLKQMDVTSERQDVTFEDSALDAIGDDKADELVNNDNNNNDSENTGNNDLQEEALAPAFCRPKFN